MTDEEKDKCHKIIHSASFSGAAVGAGMAQIPGADVPVLMGIEVTMCIALGSVFGINLEESAAKSMVAATLGTVAGRGISQALLGWIPIYGNIVNATTAVGVIETLGWALAKDFSNDKNRKQ